MFIVKNITLVYATIVYMIKSAVYKSNFSHLPMLALGDLVAKWVSATYNTLCFRNAYLYILVLSGLL